MKNICVRSVLLTLLMIITKISAEAGGQYDEPSQDDKQKLLSFDKEMIQWRVDTHTSDVSGGIKGAICLTALEIYNLKAGYETSNVFTTSMHTALFFKWFPDATVYTALETIFNDEDSAPLCEIASRIFSVIGEYE